MTTTMRAGAQVPAIPASPGDSKTTRSLLTLSIANLDGGVMLSGSIYLGKSAAAPATFAGLANPVGPMRPDPSNGDWVTYQANTPDLGTTYNVNGTMLLPLANAAWSPGDHVWVCIFDVNPAISGSVPVAVSSQILVAA